MADDTVQPETDTVSRVLNNNAEDFERADVTTMATVGYVIAALQFALGAVGLLEQEPDLLVFGEQMVVAFTIAALAFRTSQLSMLAGYGLIGSVAISLAIRALAAVLGETVDVIGLVATGIVALFVIGKMYPGVGSLKRLSETVSEPNAVLHIVDYGLLLLIALDIALSVANLILYLSSV